MQLAASSRDGTLLPPSPMVQAKNLDVKDVG